MKPVLRILVLEDVAADVDLMNHELRAAGVTFETKRVETREAFSRELENDPPDVILSDHGLPNFDGFAALDLARDHCPETPFIFVTGSMGEELAIDSLRSGATDYVLKTRISNLAPAIERALRVADERRLRRRAEKELRESEQRFRLFVSGVKASALVMVDTDGRISGWNAGAELMFGYDAADVIGKRFNILYRHEDNAAGKPEADLKLAAIEGGIERDDWRLRQSSTAFWAHVDIRAYRDEAGSLRGFTHVIRDTTERKRQDELPRENNEFRHGLGDAVLDIAPDAIISMDQAGKIIDWNPSAEQIFGYSRELAVGRDLVELILPHSKEELQRRGFARTFQTGRGRMLGQRTEMVALRANGAEFPAELTVIKIPGEGPLVFTTFIRDITERRRTEEALRKSEERLRLLVEGVEHYAIYLLDTHGRITTWNVGAERITGFRAQEIIGRRFHRFYEQGDVDRKKPDQALAVATSEGHFQDERWHLRKDGTRYWVNLVITALRDEEGKLSAFSAIARDITKRKHEEDEIRRRNIELDQRVQAQTTELQAAYQEMEAFSYSISHDLRAPLIHIAGFVEMLKTDLGPKLDEKSGRHLQTICAATETMGRMIADLLTFSRIGRAEMHRIRFDLNSTVMDVRRDLQSQINDRKVEWIVPALPEIFADPIMIRQAFYHLLGNAVKYTRPREVARIEITAESRESEYIFGIRDNGAGFEMKYASKLFGVFQRLHSASEFEGTGIGLANVRRMIGRHGGRTWATGTVNGGATFHFSLPITTPDQA